MAVLHFSTGGFISGFGLLKSPSSAFYYDRGRLRGLRVTWRAAPGSAAILADNITLALIIVQGEK